MAKQALQLFLRIWNRRAIANREDSESVVLYLEKPVVAVKRFGHQLDDLKRELRGREHVNP